MQNKYEGQSVTESQMDTKHKMCYIRTWEKHLFLYISSTNIDTLVPSLYQWVETRRTEVYCLLSQPFLHFHFNLFVITKKIPTFLDPSVNRFTRQTLPTVNRKYFLWIPLHWVLLPTKKRTTERYSWVVHSWSKVAILTTGTSLWTCASAT
jgi:hypothetical protein